MKALEKPNWRIKNEKARAIRLALIGVALFVPIIAISFYVLINIALPRFNASAQGSRILVRAGGDFQSALNRARPGDTIELQAGATFTGSFSLPKYTGDRFITIRTTVTDDNLPKEGERIDPKLYGAVLPKLESKTTNPVIDIQNGAHHYRFVGIEFQGTLDGFYNIIQIGSSEESTVEEIPHHIEFDRVYIHATSPKGQRRGIAANGRHISIKNSHISGIRRKGEESQGIAVWGSDGPIEIVNNYIEAAAENILFGGAGSKLKLVPTNCVVKGNTLFKPLAWREEGWLVKNLFEIKNGRNIVVSDNLMINNWANGQDGTAVLFTVRADNGNETVIENITFENNVIRGSAAAVSVWGGEGGGGKKLLIRNNLFADINGEKWGGRGQFLKISEWQGLTIENNTIINSGNITSAYGKSVEGFVFRNNIVFNNDYGMIGDDASPGNETRLRYFPHSKVIKNVIVGGSMKLYGPENFYVNSMRQIGFAEQEDYQLSPSSPYIDRGYGGKPIGYVAR